MTSAKGRHNQTVGSLVLSDIKGFWDIPVKNIWDDVADFEILQHFLQNQYPCAWWTSDELLDNGAPSSSTLQKGDANGTEKSQEIFKGNVSANWDDQFPPN
jgi:hypothetical protein